MKFQLPEAMIFDIDGTLFKTESILDDAYFSTFKILKEENLYADDIPSIEKMYSCLGMIVENLWVEILPNSQEAVRKYANDLLANFELELLEKGKGQLYPNVKETLQILHNKGVRLFVASNGVEAYVKGVVKYCGLQSLIEKTYSAGEYKTASKVDLVRLILQNHNLESAWMVGDRSSDVKAGKQNGLIVVGCDYSSFKDNGELNNSDILIKRFEQILDYTK